MTEEGDIYEAFDYANKFKLGAMIGEKIIVAVKSNNIEEVKRLLNLTAEEGGLILLWLTQKDENGKSAIQLAEEMNSSELTAVFRGEM